MNTEAPISFLLAQVEAKVINRIPLTMVCQITFTFFGKCFKKHY